MSTQCTPPPNTHAPYMYIYIYIYIHTHIEVINVSDPQANMYSCYITNGCPYFHMCTCIYTHVHIYLYIYIHTYTYTVVCVYECCLKRTSVSKFPMLTSVYICTHYIQAIPIERHNYTYPLFEQPVYICTYIYIYTHTYQVLLKYI